MLKAKISLCLNYFIVALLLNSVAVFVIQMSNLFNASQGVISAFAPFKDFATLIASFIFASLIPKMGVKKTTMIGLLCIVIACIVMGSYPSIISSFIFFILLGVSFSLIKVATYASVIHITKGRKEHTSFVSLIEGCFMLGILSMSWLFGVFEDFGHWTYVFWVLAILSIFATFLYMTVNIDEQHIDQELEQEEEKTIGQGVFKILFLSWIVWFFIVLSISDVFIETGLSIWLPTFNNHFLHINAAIAIELLSLFSASLALGRLFFSAILKYVKSLIVLVACMSLALVVFVASMFVIKSMPPASRILSNWTQLPPIAFWLPLVGFFIAPIYPTLCSLLLTCFSSKRFQSPIASVIVIFSAIGGIAGAALLGYMFRILGPAKGIAIPAIPLFIMLLLTIPYFWLIKRKHSCPR